MAAEDSDEEQSLPFKWNAGVGVASLVFPSWRGASESTSLVLPAPIFSIWRGNSEVGRGGIRSQLSLTDNLIIRASMSGSLPADSDESPLRRGLPDLDPTLEAGPALSWTVHQDGAWNYRLEALLRGVFTVNLKSPQWLGLTFQPRIAIYWTRGNPKTRNQWFGRLAIGPIWAERKQHRYFYSVSADHVEANRVANCGEGTVESCPASSLRAYDAAGGYSGTRANVSLSWTRDRISLAGYVGYDNLRGTAFEDSPLRPEDDYWLAGFFMSWRFFGDIRPLRLEE